MWERLNQHQEKAALQQGSKAALGTGNKQVFKGGTRSRSATSGNAGADQALP
ncbi:hypothetical protein TH47_00215 [Thalassospira sp. MCCC 1A02803]|nr:hypothetical protein TH47_00215 [Thalassospira sp. MCCC 1A02803]